MYVHVDPNPPNCPHSTGHTPCIQKTPNWDEGLRRGKEDGGRKSDGIGREAYFLSPPKHWSKSRFSPISFWQEAESIVRLIMTMTIIDINNERGDGYGYGGTRG